MNRLWSMKLVNKYKAIILIIKKIIIWIITEYIINGFRITNNAFYNTINAFGNKIDFFWNTIDII